MSKREIKFRAFDKKAGQMIFTGFHLMGEVTAFGMIEGWIDKHRFDAKTSLDRWDDIVEMQYTGARHEGGQDVYEGDLIQHYEHGVLGVAWNPSQLRWSLYDKTGQCKAHLLDVVHSPILGNIHENPELLNS